MKTLFSLMIRKLSSNSLNADTNILGIKDTLKYIFGLTDSPLKVSTSLGVGLFIGMSPTIGFQTIIGLLTAWILRLNTVVTVIGVYITNPLTVVPIYTFNLWIGLKITGVDIGFPGIDWKNITFSMFFNEMEHLIWPFIAGCTVVGIISGITGLLVFYLLLKVRGIYKKDK